MSDSFYDNLARQHGFDTFRQWVEAEHCRRAVEDAEFMVRAERFMWGDAAAERLRREQHKRGNA